MKPSLTIEQELSGFIRFGDLMTPDLRLFVAELLFSHLYNPRYPALLHLKQSEIERLYPNWFSLFHQLLEQEDLRKTTAYNEDFCLSVSRQILNWTKQICQKFETGYEHADEEAEFNQTLNRNEPLSREKWMEILVKLDKQYPEHQQSWQFYGMRMSETPITEHDAWRVLEQQVMEDWEHHLTGKKNKLQASFLDDQTKVYLDQLGKKVEQLLELGDMVAPYYNFLGQMWNSTLSDWERIHWDKMEEYADKLENDPNLRQLVELLGRWSLSEQDWEAEKMMQPIEEEIWEPNPHGKSEITGITYGDHISAILPSEVALLSSHETGLVFAKKFVEKKLLTFQYRSEDGGKRESETPKQQAFSSRQTRGPMIMCIDTSGSMFGEPEQIAKALALAILNIAAKQKRKAYLISFSTTIQTIEMTGLEEDISHMIDFLEMSFHGGTDIQPALKEALDMLKKEDYRKADILVLSDFIIPRLDKDVYESVLESRRELQTKYHGLLITRGFDARIPPLPVFDHHWVYDLDNPKVMRQTIAHFQQLKKDETISN